MGQRVLNALGPGHWNSQERAPEGGRGPKKQRGAVQGPDIPIGILEPQLCHKRPMCSPAVRPSSSSSRSDF